MKNLCLLFAIVCLFFNARSQGLENVIVERYYVSDAADATGSSGVLPTGSVTYRIYIDMAPGYNLQALYGVTGHTLLLSTTTSFFNNEDYGNTNPNSISATNVRKNSTMLDSWFSMGAACNGKLGVQKTEDTDGSVGNANGILANNDPSAGSPISVTDGMMPGTTTSVTFVGINNTGNGDLAVFDGISQVGNLFTTDNGSVAALGGVTGPTGSNAVLVAQITTDGIFSFELNLQLGTPNGGTEQYVASNPTGNEVQFPGLIYNSGSLSVPVMSSKSDVFEVYPNPTTGSVYINGTDESSESRIISAEIRSISGAINRTIDPSMNDLNSPVRVDMADMPAGMYFLDCKTAKTTEIHKVIKY